jgi:hypothetical protein
MTGLVSSKKKTVGHLATGTAGPCKEHLLMWMKPLNSNMNHGMAGYA